MPEPDALRIAERAQRRPRRTGRLAAFCALVLVGAAVYAAIRFLPAGGPAAATQAAAPPPPPVTVSTPLQQMVAPVTTFLGQFSAVDSVEIRAQVGGTLTAIGFRDGAVVHKGDALFVIDPRPYAIRLAMAQAQLQTAQARRTLADVELWRAQQLKQTSFGTVENVDQRQADQRSADAAIDTAKAAIADAQLDLEFANITAPFTGRMGAHLASVGSLVSGSRGGTGPSTLLATIVSTDPIYLDFDMSEADYATFEAGHPGRGASVPVTVTLGGEDGGAVRQGTLDFIDNVVNRGSGTIHARATVPNADGSLTPGQFARVAVPMGSATSALLVPPASIVPDQDRELVMTVAADDKVQPKQVQLGGIYHGLRVVSAGLLPTEHVIIAGLIRARPGMAVTPVPGHITQAAD